MEEQKMNEKESLELIAQMIRVTKQSIGSGCGNKFLMYGYTAAILSIVIYALVYGKQCVECRVVLDVFAISCQ